MTGPYICKNIFHVQKLKYFRKSQKLMIGLILGIFMVFVFSLGMISTADAHPHATIDLMESHSHDIHDEKFQGHFLVHTFEEVVFSVTDFFNNILFDYIEPILNERS